MSKSPRRIWFIKFCPNGLLFIANTYDSAESEILYSVCLAWSFENRGVRSMNLLVGSHDTEVDIMHLGQIIGRLAGTCSATRSMHTSKL